MAPARFATRGRRTRIHPQPHAERRAGGFHAELRCGREADGGQRLYLARYSAHGTAYGEEMLQFNNDHAGAFQRSIKEKSGAALLYMGGAVGAMRPNPPARHCRNPGPRNSSWPLKTTWKANWSNRERKHSRICCGDQQARVEAMGAAMPTGYLLP